MTGGSRLIRRLKRLLKLIPGVKWLATQWRVRRKIGHGEQAIKKLGHRDYVGGQWEEKGRLQFQMMVDQGLRPEHYLCDVACGSLRGGVHFIGYLQPGHYLGIEKEQMLIDAGVKEELGEEVFAARRPEFVVSDSFEFERFSARPDYALAQSLFTHLPPPLIGMCMQKLRGFIKPDGVFLATFFETDRPIHNPSIPHDRHSFKYTRGEMEQFGREAGWRAEYIGDWGHPRGQQLIKYTPQPEDGGE